MLQVLLSAAHQQHDVRRMLGVVAGRRKGGDLNANKITLSLQR
jgi:hypothetical protein